MNKKAGQPIWQQHGLKQYEYEFLVNALGREPNHVELGITGAMWSEHCSYKSSRRWLKKLPTQGQHVVLGPGENAGVVRLQNEWCLAFKIESHNHPSYIEPYHGAATGVGGILRDVFTMGARPIANLNSLRFGDPHHPRTAYLVQGVVRGIADYGNCVGVPMIAGETSFSPCYNGNILVNAMTIGLVKEDEIFLGRASGIGNPVFYVGSKTGRDGIHGATMASAAFDDGVQDQRPTVQVGDPFTEKLLLEACLELMRSGCVVGIQDMGAAGLTSSSFEMAGRAGSGIDLYLDRVPAREGNLGPYELMLSESQERMLIVLEKGKEAAAHAIFEKWDLAIAEIGTVTNTGFVRCYWHGELAAQLPVELLTEQCPLPQHTSHANPQRLALQEVKAAAASDFHPLSALKQLLGHPSIAAKQWIIDQYDSTVQGNTLIEPGGPAGVIWVPEAQKAIAATVEGNGRLVYLHPRHGASHVIAEAVRNLICVGATPLGATDCLNFGNPEKPEAYWELIEACEGLADGLRAMNIAIVSGNVSLYNETMGQGIWPTPMVGMVGRVDVPTKNLPKSYFDQEGLDIVVLGSHPTTLAGSAYQHLVQGLVEGQLPAPEWDILKNMQQVMHKALTQGLIRCCDDVAEGGLLTRLTEMSLPNMIGVHIQQLSPQPEILFGEDGQQLVIAVDPQYTDRILTMVQEHGVPVTYLGKTVGNRLYIDEFIDLPLAGLVEIYQQSLNHVVKEQADGF